MMAHRLASSRAMPNTNLRSGPEPMLRDFVQQIPLAMAVFNDSGKPCFVNGQFVETYGTEVLDSEAVRALLSNPCSDWKCIRIAGQAKSAAPFKARAIQFHGNAILIAEDLESPALLQQLNDLRARVSDLEKLSSTDALTGVWNRAHFDRVIDVEVSRSNRQHQPISLILVDIDRFKDINDTFGHLVGDGVLRTLAGVIAASTRLGDSLFRWGGEEFLVLAPAIGYRGSARLAEKIRSAVEACHFPNVESVTISAGVAEHLATESIDVWFGRADAALYDAKNSGRNRVYVDERGSSDAWATESGASVVRLVWQEAYECGEPSIDQEHRDLFVLANAMLDAFVADEDPSEAFRSTLNKLLEHTVRHFANEEAQLQKIGYMHLTEHRRAHAQLLARAADLKAGAEAGMARLGDLVEFMAQSVVAQHLFKSDKNYFPLFKSNR